MNIAILSRHLLRVAIFSARINHYNYYKEII